MECWLYDLVSAHRERLESRDEGALWLTFISADGVLTSAVIEGAMEHVDEPLLAGLVEVVDGAGADSVVLVVPRHDGRPRAVDQRVWLEMTTRVDPRTEVVDLILIGPHDSWSMRDAMLEQQES